MIGASSALKAHLAQPVTTLCRLWKITRTDTAVFRFTDLDRDVVMPGDGRYLAAVGYRTSAAQSRAGLAPSNIEVQAVFDSLAITEADLRAGLWDGAAVEVMLANYADPGMGVLPLPGGRVGEVRYDGLLYAAELLGIMQRLAVTIGRVVSLQCDAILGDARCGVNLATWTHAFTVTSVTSRGAFADSALAQAAGYFDFGLVSFSTGENAGLPAMEVKRHEAGGALTLFLPAPREIAVGDTGTAIAGCAKTGRRGSAHCRDKFDNLVNFRGFEDLPGNDRLMAAMRT